MRSLIILEVEHGETTDPLGEFLCDLAEKPWPVGFEVKDFTVRVDLPACFVLDSTHTD